MKFAKGPRPWSIWLFALVTTAGLINILIGDLSDLVVAEVRYGWMAPSFDWDKDSLIVVASAAFTIKMIPVVLIWGFATRIARWLYLAMAILPLPFDILKIIDRFSWLLSEGYDDQATRFLSSVSFAYAVQVGLIVLLFLPPSNRWFARKGEVDKDVFE